MRKIALLFAGQGAQSVGMGKDLYDSYPVAKEIFDMGEAIRPGTLKTCFEGPGEDLTLTENTQPCLFLTDLACAKVLEEAGVEVAAAAGFSLGEIPALAFSGVLSNEDAFKLVVTRGKVMSECSAEHPGGMAAVLKLENSVVEEICSQFKEVYPVNYNCHGQVSCAGAADEIDGLVDAVKAAGGRAVKLAVSGAFHTPYMQKATFALAEQLMTTDMSSPKMDLYSNLLGDKYPENDCAAVADIVSRQCSNSVRWEDSVKKMAENGITTFVEVGPGTTLSGLVKKILPEAEIYNVSNTETLKTTLEALEA